MRRMKAEHGQSVIEFALVLPMLMVVCVGMAELGRATWAWNMAQMAASEGARRGIVISNGAWADSVDSGVHAILWGRDHSTEKMFSSNLTITKTVDHTVTPNLLVVDVKIPMNLIIPLRLLNKGATNQSTYNIHGRASLPVQPAFVENVTP